MNAVLRDWGTIIFANDFKSRRSMELSVEMVNGPIEQTLPSAQPQGRS